MRAVLCHVCAVMESAGIRIAVRVVHFESVSFLLYLLSTIPQDLIILMLKNRFTINQIYSSRIPFVWIRCYFSDITRIGVRRLCVPSGFISSSDITDYSAGTWFKRGDRNEHKNENLKNHIYRY